MLRIFKIKRYKLHVIWADDDINLLLIKNEQYIKATNKLHRDTNHRATPVFCFLTSPVPFFVCKILNFSTSAYHLVFATTLS